MHCPDCGGSLAPIALGDKAQAYRCFKCGGFWLDGWTVNRLNTQSLDIWRRINISTMLLAHGKGLCPQDQSVLETYRGESVPPTMTVKRCQRCGKWWFPGDVLFDYKPALEAKVNYYRLWGMSSNVFNMILPVMGIALLVAGLATGMTVIREKTQVGTKASQGSVTPSIMYLGKGETEIAFVSSVAVETVSFRKHSEETWTQVSVKMNKGLYEASLTGIIEGENYVLKISGKEYLMRVTQ